jgi:hypothetical protein
MVEHELVQLEVFERHAFQYCGEELLAVFLDEGVFLYYLIVSSTGHVAQRVGSVVFGRGNVLEKGVDDRLLSEFRLFLILNHNIVVPELVQLQRELVLGRHRHHRNKVLLEIRD